MVKIQAIFLVFVSTIMLTACSLTLMPTEDASFLTPIPKETHTTSTPTPTLTPTPTTVPGLIVTKWGSYKISSVQHALRMPPDCDEKLPDACSILSITNYHILILYLEKITPGASDATKDDIARSGAYVVANDGSKADLIANGVLSGEEFIAFRIPAASFSYILYWPGNPPLDLSH